MIRRAHRGRFDGGGDYGSDSFQWFAASADGTERHMHVGGISERHKEIKRRRHRRKKLVHFSKRLKKATFSEKTVIADKLRNLTPGVSVIIENWQLADSDR